MVSGYVASGYYILTHTRKLITGVEKVCNEC